MAFIDLIHGMIEVGEELPGKDYFNIFFSFPSFLFFYSFIFIPVWIQDISIDKCGMSHT